jgi:phasin family protein
LKTPEDLMKMQSEMASAASAAAMKTLEGFRKLTDVNLQAARASLEQSADQINALLAAKDVSTLTSLVTSFAQPSADKFTNYARAVYAVTSETNADLAKMVQDQIAKANVQLAAGIEQLARSAPSGSEGGMSFIRQAMSTANASYEQFNDQMKKVVEMGAMGTTQPGAKKGR